MIGLKPFWRYYGGKWRAAPRYPKPVHPTVVEPFAGAAGYSLRYPDRRVVLVEKYAVVAEVWRYLICVRASEIRSIPLVDNVTDLPAHIALGARHLVGFTMNSATTSPRLQMSAGLRRQRDSGRTFSGWSAAQRERVASQVEHIRHWQVIEGDYTTAPDVQATWFVDPPYQELGSHYVHHQIDYPALSAWCRKRIGQVLVCEMSGADWLPFMPFAACKAAMGRTPSQEVLWETTG